MELELEIEVCLCSLATFQINGIKANIKDFVNKYDHKPENSVDYGCGDMKADIIPATNEVLNKYNISLDEYNKVAERVSSEVSFGNCNLCT